MSFINDLPQYWQVFVSLDSNKHKNFETSDEAISYAEHLLNQRYCWLPQNNDWIMSGEVYNFANNGANKVLELQYLAETLTPSFRQELRWYFWRGCLLSSAPSALCFQHGGITIPAESPIWDAVKGLSSGTYYRCNVSAPLVDAFLSDEC